MCCVDQLLVLSVGHRGQWRAEKICSARDIMPSYAEVNWAVPLWAHVKVVPLGSVRPSMLCKHEDFYRDILRCSTVFWDVLSVEELHHSTGLDLLCDKTTSKTWTACKQSFYQITLQQSRQVWNEGHTFEDVFKQAPKVWHVAGHNIWKRIEKGVIRTVFAIRNKIKGCGHQAFQVTAEDDERPDFRQSVRSAAKMGLFVMVFGMESSASVSIFFAWGETRIW